MTGCMSLDVTGFFSDSSTVPFGTKKGGARLAGDRLEVGALEVGRRADEHRLGELQLQLLLGGIGLRRQWCEGQGKQQGSRECARDH